MTTTLFSSSASGFRPTTTISRRWRSPGAPRSTAGAPESPKTRPRPWRPSKSSSGSTQVRLDRTGTRAEDLERARFLIEEFCCCCLLRDRRGVQHPGHLPLPPPLPPEGGAGDDHAAGLRLRLLGGPEAPVPLAGGQERM